MSNDNEMDWRRKENWIRDPADYPNYPPRSVRSGMKWNPNGIAHLENWHKFFAGLRDKPPGQSGLLRPSNDDGSLYFGPADPEPTGGEGRDPEQAKEGTEKVMWDKPRDPERIPEVLAALETRWREAPDQRLGQVLMNLVRRELAPEPADEANRLFALEDDTLLEMLKRSTSRPSAS